MTNRVLDQNNQMYFILLGSGEISKVVSPDHPDLTFTLSLIRSDPTFEQPEQLWQFESDFAVSHNIIHTFLFIFTTYKAIKTMSCIH